MSARAKTSSDMLKKRPLTGLSYRTPLILLSKSEIVNRKMVLKKIIILQSNLLCTIITKSGFVAG
jgi:hypothetical protein